MLPVKYCLIIDNNLKLLLGVSLYAKDMVILQRNFVLLLINCYEETYFYDHCSRSADDCIVWTEIEP